MKIYIAHSRGFDFRKELYDPIKNSSLAREHTFIFPHEKSEELFSSKDFFQNGCDLIIAEVSYPATGLGIELGWANMLKVPVVCIYKKDSILSGSLKAVTNTFLQYSDTSDLIDKITQAIQVN
ncbi:MAG: hypothetical protein A3G52_03790 [Candidatus Taylorbacteria bacterium RIFCSPLOWO2_12_FULL_43_20]|uniref:2'-deoxynucleoside 5'-phosphate N-hydrolase 1 n=1 Tax=Candidatus Taylorbacteria bacterium RIFCSPLOWO2_12_FULL_43_20 TaxID=1802332 RepID=A0A1G2P1U0_9BACT|nr:MAG: hypothetical protein A3B98_01535 [Candidatus Taylorbacteria bacterium RIFCSPHIGHO2_02_FULL_43_55]OHA29359.1 MAG: hypothetical protein A3E92_02360 [Candidatus Taylorbacteria bacterium RIFCSPHIGHO2_12_FULL_42_34]OHA31736.1 MAG: hypothetical protein A3B09_01805 [Candidatus Taylorbacteria bacterium RIFCSPLOWO2_01_FULL_43_83]OHA38787.1 MAG: hypothetical protein A3H58_01915 [Candidatus Taylorbacteria bacterium RIFCSPLOWO2_02_FULL_43_22b]OHA42290.1 MAG: hypothetical protein A3G52_03790 [Candid